VRIEPEEPSFDPATWSRGDEAVHLARGVRLFNEGAYHAAHEEFERVWLSTEGADSDFYKGLIQAAICLHHLERGNLDGARGLYGGHRRLLAAYLPAHLGLDVAALLADMQRALGPALRGERAGLDAASAPRLQSAPSSDGPSGPPA
jgi:predicted metal-dependent hydrolase